MSKHNVLAELEAERRKLHRELEAVGDIRRGTVSHAYRRCGKPYCACSDPDHPGHGPVHMLTKSVEGKTMTKVVHPGPELAKVEREAAGYRRFKGIVEQVVEVNEQICEARPLADAAASDAAGGGEKRGPSGRRSRQSSRGK